MSRKETSRLGGLLRRLAGVSDGRDQEVDTVRIETSEARYRSPSDEAAKGARQSLALMMREALDVLEARGLPSRPGFYAFDARLGEWTFLSASLAPAERWAKVLEAPQGQGRRYVTLDQRIRAEAPDDLAACQAADVLEQASACLRAADAGTDGLESAVRLANAWAEFRLGRQSPVRAARARPERHRSKSRALKSSDTGSSRQTK